MLLCYKASVEQGPKKMMRRHCAHDCVGGSFESRFGKTMDPDKVVNETFFFSEKQTNEQGMVLNFWRVCPCERIFDVRSVFFHME